MSSVIDDVLDLVSVDIPDLKKPELYINRELSLLEFNLRVLEQARDESTPLIERLRFLCISCSNMDEFFEVRVAGLKQKAELGSVQANADGKTPVESLKVVCQRAHELVHEQYQVLNELLIPQLREQQIYILRRNEWNPSQKDWLKKYFREDVLPVLSPLGLDPAHPFPRVPNKSLNFIISLRGKDAFGRNIGMAVIPAARSLPRIVKLPPQECDCGPNDFIFLSSIIHAFVDELFPQMKVEGFWQFRVTRNSDLFVHEEEVDDLLRAVEGELASRRFGDCVRLELTENCPDKIAEFLLKRFELERDDLYQVSGPVNLNHLQEIADSVDRADLKYTPFTPALPALLSPEADLFKVLRKQDILLHHPFESFVPVIDFIRQAATDPQVLAIKQTLYRAGSESAIVDALVKAAMAGKEVTMVIELRARFDEQANITLANRLQEAGVNILYGVVGYKTHAKMALVVRREGKHLRRYVHLGTGNYHARTARLYTDYGLLTSNKQIGEDVHNIFLQLTSLGKVSELNQLLQSPFTLHKALLQKIDREIENALQKKPARIIAKFNSLVEPQVIQALYRASIAGVRIDLIVRGVCALRPGIEGISDNIRVRSIIGRFLEHTRIFYFENSGDPEVFASSADWMERNFFRRVEVAFPFVVKKIRDRVINDLHNYLSDNTQTWELHADGSYHRLVAEEGQENCSAQQTLLESLAEHA